MKAKVYFSKQITPEKVVELYKAVGLELPGKVAVKDVYTNDFNPFAKAASKGSAA